MAKSGPFPLSDQRVVLSKIVILKSCEIKTTGEHLKAMCIQAPSSVKLNASKIRPKRHIVGPYQALCWIVGSFFSENRSY